MKAVWSNLVAAIIIKKSLLVTLKGLFINLYYKWLRAGNIDSSDFITVPAEEFFHLLSDVTLLAPNLTKQVALQKQKIDTLKSLLPELYRVSKPPNHHSESTLLVFTQPMSKSQLVEISHSRVRKR